MLLRNRHAAFALAALFWLALWHVGSVLVGEEILLVSPLAAAARLFEMLQTPVFWQTAGFSLLRIMGGFLLALLSGILLAAAAYRFKLAHALLAPLTGAAKSVPVASYTILCLVFLRARSLPLIIAFLMTLPIVYDTLLEGLRNTDRKMLDMAKVFRLTPLRRLRAIYVPQCLPYLVSSAGVGVGIAWKAGIAAEVIGLPQGSIGARLYETKLYLDMRGLFAWTIAVMLLCFVLEKLLLLLINRAARALERM
ncbi:MAG: ABC transporter permease subunit [Oscillospiraceae bacterium]|jgi:NitT/TauT family transport system permease protein|nr:ABC transporter permease subunit [Oscillospiraceae bacterium]